MPYASRAQQRKFHALLAEGKIDPAVVREFDEASRGLDLPERVRPKGAAQGVYTVKSAAHPHDRMEERTEFHRDNVEPIQQLVDLMGLKPGSYHLPLRDKAGNVAGYAVFKGVPGRKSPVLSTVYAKYMPPPGANIEEMLHGGPKVAR